MNNYEIMGRMLDGTLAQRLEPRVKIMRRLRSLAAKHQRQCVNHCNGEGYIPGIGFISTASKAGYAEDGETSLFDVEITKLEAKLSTTVKALGPKYRVTFQHDPRGWTVRIEQKQTDRTWWLNNRLTSILYT